MSIYGKIKEAFNKFFDAVIEISRTQFTFDKEGNLVNAYNYFAAFTAEQAKMKKIELEKQLKNFISNPMLFNQPDPLNQLGQLNQPDPRQYIDSLLEILVELHPSLKENPENNLTHEPKTL